MPVNMSYCRFRNTLAALRECYESEACEATRPEQFLSEEEAEAFVQLVRLCDQFAYDFLQEGEL